MTYGKTFLSALLNPTDEERKVAAWQRARPITGSDPAIVRIDCDGRIIWLDHGLRSEYGWEIDHIVPLALNGLDTLSNLRARHWRGNSRAGGLLSGILDDVGR